MTPGLGEGFFVWFQFVGVFHRYPVSIRGVSLYMKFLVAELMK